MREILPGILHWKAVHPKLGIEVSSYYVEPARALIDPLAPAEVVEELESDERPERILLTNRHHLRDSGSLSERFGCPILCSEKGLHEFEGGPEVQGFAFGQEVAPGIEALEVDAICPEEAALLIGHGGGALAVADGVINYGRLRFVRDYLLGDDPEAIKRALIESYARLLDRPFDALLFAHGEPIASGGKAALREFTEASVH
jgi:glyoxylase-like metal-dependent hydrolase (beta-lactamase superfamily II)